MSGGDTVKTNVGACTTLSSLTALFIQCGVYTSSRCDPHFISPCGYLSTREVARPAVGGGPHARMCVVLTRRVIYVGPADNPLRSTVCFSLALTS